MGENLEMRVERQAIGNPWMSVLRKGRAVLLSAKTLKNDGSGQLPERHSHPTCYRTQ
jgi:hypothetical protein